MATFSTTYSMAGGDIAERITRLTMTESPVLSSTHEETKQLAYQRTGNQVTQEGKANQEKMSLMTLPAEIRNKIFNLAFINRNKETGALQATRMASLQAGRLRFLIPLHINIHLRQELRPLIYGANLFVLKQTHNPNTQPMLQWNKKRNGVDFYMHGYCNARQKWRFSMELPPVAARKLMRNIRVVLAEPVDRDDNVDEERCKKSERKWCRIDHRLNVVRNLANMGFEKLDLLELHVSVAVSGSFVRSGGHEQAVKENFRTRCEAKVREMDTLGARVVVKDV